MKGNWQNVVGLLVVLAFFSLNTPRFFVNELEFTSLGIVTTEELRAFASFTEGNIFRADLVLLADNLRRHPWIHTVEVFWHWPNRILVEVQEREPVAKISFDRVWLYLDASGELLPRPIEDKFFDLPIVQLTDLNSPDQRMQAALVVARLPESLLIRMSQWNQDAKYFLTREGITIRVGEATDMMRKYQILDALFGELAQEEELPYLIDLQAPNTPVVHFR